MFRFSAVNLWCNKNLVDLEFAIGEILKFSDRYEIEFFENPEDEEVEFVLVNTCGFLSSSRQESEETLAYYDSLGKKTILMGCYVSVKDDAFLSSLKHLYRVVPFIDYPTIESLLQNKKPLINLPALAKIKAGAGETLKEAKLKEYLSKIWGSQLKNKAFIWKWDEVRAYLHAPFRYEYLKVAEGCDNNCTFCIIPKIRGRQKSRPIEDIVSEVKIMLENGIEEIEIIAQDTARYGTDIYGESRLFELLEAIENIDWDFKFRVFYLYPDTLTLEHLEKFKNFKKFIPYFDIPFQHISEKILRLMGRFYDGAHIRTLLDFIRKEFKESIIRTSFIIGFPGEWNEEFNELLEFVKKYRFESVGVFEYHDEPLAASSKLPEKLDDKTISFRREKLGSVIDSIYADIAKKERGKTFQWYVMDFDENTITVRRELKAPEIDEYDVITKVQEVEIGDLISYKL